MIRRPRRSTLFPYTPLFRSCVFLRRFFLKATTFGARSCATISAATEAPESSGAPILDPANRTSEKVMDAPASPGRRSEEHTSELQSQSNLVCRLLLEKKKT